MISEIRDYFKQVIRAVNSDLKSVNQPVAIDIPDSQIEDAYRIIIGSASSDRQDTTIESDFAVTVELWSNGYQDQIENYDSAYCEAIDVQATAMDQKRIMQNTTLKSVVSGGIEPEPVIDNDNLYKFTIQFNVKVIYKTNINI